MLFGSSIRDSHARHISADVQRITLNASSCITISGEWTEQLDIITGFLPRRWLYEWFSQFHICGIYSVLSRSPSILQLQRPCQRYTLYRVPIWLWVWTCLKFADFRIFLQRHGEEVCGDYASGTADYCPAAVHYQNWWNVLLHLCMDLRTGHISGESR